jgi:hypothetical protein
MKLTNRTTPQAKNYMCDKCKTIHSHKDMYDDNICYDCKDELDKEVISK